RLLPVRLAFLAELLWNLDDLELRAQRLVLEVDALHLDQVDDAAVVRLDSPGNLDRSRLRGQLGPHHLDAARKVRAHAVHLVDEGDTRNLVAVGLAPD